MIRSMTRRIGGAPRALVRALRRLNWPGRILVALVGAGTLGIGTVEMTGQPGFCNSCHVMHPYYDSWKKSSHAGVNCLDCHLRPGLTGYVKGKINGLAQAIDCAVGRIGTKPNATVLDVSCLRSECHSVEKLSAEPVELCGVRFTHEKHLNKVVDGVKIKCATCHSHFEGDEHFTVNEDACFSCHFLGGDTGNGRVVHTDCQSCHKVPEQVIRRGFVKIDHREFVSYQASCEGSCHKRQVVQPSRVEETVCLDCHSFRKPADANSVDLHARHTDGDKVECFACHGKVPHGRTQVESVSAMMNCQSCHSDTHQVQRTIYSTQHPLQPNSTERVLSPMFMTHVECTGCHIERTARTPGTLDSFGTVARAVPAACDKCHEGGTGQKYVPFWQARIHSLYEQVDKKVKEFELLTAAEKDPARVRERGERARQARSILDSIRYDGSWGVHNFKYTEALLLQAEKTVSNGS
jgi:hypothetical protein